VTAELAVILILI